MSRSDAEWERWFERREAKKKKKTGRAKRESMNLSSPSTSARMPLARVVGEPTLLTDSWKRSKIFDFADFRRANPTPAEAELCRILNNLNGGALRRKFEREHVISGKWIVDFFFRDIRLAIEVDGSIHMTEHQLRRDKLKDADCVKFDITVLRVPNSEVFGRREALIEKLRSGWRMALTRKNQIIGLSWEDYSRRDM